MKKTGTMSMMEQKLRGEYDDSKDRREPVGGDRMKGAMKKAMKKAMNTKAGKKK